MELTVEQIVTACKAPPKMQRIETPGWAAEGEKDAHVFVRALKADSATRVAEMCQGHEGEKLCHEKMYADWCILCCCDSSGNLLFDESHREGLLAGPFQPLQECGNAALALNGISSDETAKNSDSRDDSSRSGSPKNSDAST